MYTMRLVLSPLYRKVEWFVTCLSTLMPLLLKDVLYEAISLYSTVPAGHMMIYLLVESKINERKKESNE